MKLVTTIKPRADGNVIVHGNDGNDYSFEANEHGELVCDVECNDTIENLVNTGNFFPFDADDYAAALSHIGQDDERVEADMQPEMPDSDDDAGEDEVPNGGMPVEAETPPASKPKAGSNKAKAK